jgi:hypothetical protein
MALVACATFFYVVVDYTARSPAGHLVFFVLVRLQLCRRCYVNWEFDFMYLECSRGALMAARRVYISGEHRKIKNLLNIQST